MPHSDFNHMLPKSDTECPPWAQGLAGGRMKIDRMGRPILGEFWLWQQRELKKYSEMPYEKLCDLPEELEVDGPFQHEGLKYFVRREIELEGFQSTPKGTVEVSICVEVYDGGTFSA